ncbi:hypothetical protein [Haloplanus salinarum]|uniref:hypothetical protein n=1 Tax=Haloplanus salinarum TaxID=1912324 RepID=UPI00214D0107|nr:hypothetical protein [Haloplanus salinarum]
MIGTSAGATPRTTDEVPRSNRPDDGSCTFCRADADGVDAAREGNPPVCSNCAKIRADGGIVDCSACPRPLDRGVAVKYDGELYHLACLPDTALVSGDDEIVTDGGVTVPDHVEKPDCPGCGTDMNLAEPNDATGPRGWQCPACARFDWEGKHSFVTDGGVTSYETELDETHDCGTNLIRVDADDPENTHGVDVVVCPACLEIIRKEGSV